jgi:hypothetical protein
VKTIREALLNEGSVLHLTGGYLGRWLVGNDDGKTFVVYQWSAYHQMTLTVIETEDEAAAIKAMFDADMDVT